MEKAEANPNENREKRDNANQGVIKQKYFSQDFDRKYTKEARVKKRFEAKVSAYSAGITHISREVR